ncbi:hypothetical protein [Bacillus sp. WP8]|uniref:hypothetical protein n=1 Tax=Bacillus sp. WP8 TaxID=756828 RepID=UPI0011A95057|nr:hypothetical protein [Bacillus sp. WP8]
MIKRQYDDEKDHVHVLSYGGGTQSTALLLMALKGEINGVIPDYIIFSDTGNEPRYVIKQMRRVNKYIKEKYNKEIIVTSKGNIYEDLMRASETGERVASLPFHTINSDTGLDGFGRRQCTEDYKIVPIKKKIRELLGYKPRQRIKEMVHMWKGISTNEIQRVKPIQDKWITAEHPLVDVVDIDRSRCITYVERELGFTPKASACIICPFHDNSHWLEIKRGDSDGFEDACKLDEKIRNGLAYKDELFLHKSRKPLRKVDFNEDQLELDLDIDHFLNECEGMCGV